VPQLEALRADPPDQAILLEHGEGQLGPRLGDLERQGQVFHRRLRRRDRERFRDLQALAQIEDLGDFRRLMRAAALRLGSVVNQADLARDIGLSRPTAHRWLNLLETSFQVVRLNAYAVNRTKRLVKSAKLYWSDVGLARHLSGGEASGAHLENLVLADLIAWRELVTPRPDVHYWRTVNQEEVDFVIEAGRTLLPVEVKASARPSHRDARHLLTFRDEYGKAVVGGLVLHAGDETFWLAEGVLAAPWWRVV
jgi:hypothetical protein